MPRITLLRWLRPRNLAGLALALASLALASCGGGAGPGSESQPPAAAQAADAMAATPAPGLPQASGTLDATALFTWAQANYPQHFSGSFSAGVYQQRYVYRYYPATGNYLALASGDVYILGPVSGGQLQHVAPLGGFKCRILPADCTAATPASPYGVYTGLPGGPSPDALMLLSPFSGTVSGYNNSADGTQKDVFYGTSSAVGNFWFTNILNFGHQTAAGLAPGTAQLQGSVASGSMNATVTQAAPLISAHLSLRQDSLSALPASAATIGGSYSSPSSGQNISIDALSGEVTGTLAAGCTVTGTLSTTDLTVNVYIGQIVLGASACPAIGRFSMLGYYDPGASGGGMLTLMGGTPGSNPFQYLTLRLRRSG